MNMLDLQDEYRGLYSDLEGDASGRAAAQESLDHSTAIYHGEVTGMGYLPKLYDTEALALLNSIATTTYGILEKMTQRYLSDPDYRALFGFSPLLEQLIMLPCGYDCTIPIARVDIFLDERSGDFKFCEFNTDGTSAMNEDRAICDAIATGSTFARMAERHTLAAQELFDPWVETFLRICEECSTVAIIDYIGSATIYEFEEFRARFERAGCRCIICDIPSLQWHDGILYGRDYNPTRPEHDSPTPIDAIYRRAVTHEILQELEQDAGACDRALGAQALLQAVATQSVCMVGGFRTQVAHSKEAFRVLHLPQTGDFLSEKERDFIRRHIPYTVSLDAQSIDLSLVIADKDRWIIKPQEGYGTVGVFAGLGVTQQEWERLISEHASNGYIIQEYATQFATPNVRPRSATGELEPFNILTGLYLYGGRFAGTFVRAGQHPLIVGFHGGVTLGSLLVDYNGSANLDVRKRPLDE
jgi:hypothetical protein